jgi:DNA-binding response OmpR family regulator
MRVMVVDDEPQSMAFLIEALDHGDFDFVRFTSTSPAIRYMISHSVDLAIVDFQLPGPDGLVLAKRLRLVRPDCTIVMVSKYATEDDIQQGFGAQVDDFVKLPYSSASLRMRVNEAIARRHKVNQATLHPQRDPAVALRFLDFDPTRRTIVWHGERLKLTPFEVRLLTCLTSEPRYFNYSELYLRLYGEELSVAEATRKLRTPLNRLRNKLEAGGHPRTIESARRSGFRWCPTQEVATRLLPELG